MILLTYTVGSWEKLLIFLHCDVTLLEFLMHLITYSVFGEIFSLLYTHVWK